MPFKRLVSILDPLSFNSQRSIVGRYLGSVNTRKNYAYPLNFCNNPQWSHFGALNFGIRYQTITTEANGRNQSEGNIQHDSIPEPELLLKKEVENLNESIAELQDKYKRSLAEYENLRKRMLKQIEDAKLFGIQSFTKDLLEVADILHKATESIPEKELEGGSSHLRSLYEGLRMTEAQLLHVFKRHNVVQINPVGEKFDPNQHEALFEQVVEGKPAGIVAIVTKIGYKLQERTIRPALVGVTKSP